ncbi:MAG: hypothetical protein M1812_001479 [Candelaria pacifica]|nr:MAG: hypothetical protein M1812_001479 [Candelaria pacifica]
MDYTCEKGAKRNFEVWRSKNEGDDDENEEERLDRLEKEEEKNTMQELEVKTLDAKREMAIADALDEIRTRNARNERVDNGKGDVVGVRDEGDLERERAEREDEEVARRAFLAEDGERVRRLAVGEEVIEDEAWGNGEGGSGAIAVSKAVEMPPPAFKRVPKKKKDLAAALGIKKKVALV